MNVMKASKIYLAVRIIGCQQLHGFMLLHFKLNMLKLKITEDELRDEL